jgi:hypothetical protein
MPRALPCCKNPNPKSNGQWRGSSPVGQKRPNRREPKGKIGPQHPPGGRETPLNCFSGCRAPLHCNSKSSFAPWTLPCYKKPKPQMASGAGRQLAKVAPVDVSQRRKQVPNAPPGVLRHKPPMARSLAHGGPKRVFALGCCSAVPGCC